MCVWFMLWCSCSHGEFQPLNKCDRAISTGCEVYVKQVHDVADRVCQYCSKIRSKITEAEFQKQEAAQYQKTFGVYPEQETIYTNRPQPMSTLLQPLATQSTTSQQLQTPQSQDGGGDTIYQGSFVYNTPDQQGVKSIAPQSAARSLPHTISVSAGTAFDGDGNFASSGNHIMPSIDQNFRWPSQATQPWDVPSLEDSPLGRFAPQQPGLDLGNIWGDLGL